MFQSTQTLAGVAKAIAGQIECGFVVCCEYTSPFTNLKLKVAKILKKDAKFKIKRLKVAKTKQRWSGKYSEAAQKCNSQFKTGKLVCKLTNEYK